MIKNRNLSYIKDNLFLAITELAIGAGSSSKRLNSAYNSYIYKLSVSKMYLELMSEESAELYIVLNETFKRVYDDYYKKYKQEYGAKPSFRVEPIRYLHYKTANKIIELILSFYESICKDMYE